MGWLCKPLGMCNVEVVGKLDYVLDSEGADSDVEWEIVLVGGDGLSFRMG